MPGEAPLAGCAGSVPSFGKLMLLPAQETFGTAKRDALPQYCLDCEVRFACHGECPKNRFTATSDGEPGLNYLCAGYRRFFHHIDRPMRMMLDLMRSGRPAADVMAILRAEDVELEAAVRQAGRNEPPALPRPPVI